MAISKRTRFEVLKRDNHTCRYCGATAPDATLTVDHVTPVALGGGDEPSNLVAACRDCNAGKSSTSPDAAVVEDVKETDLRWADAIKRVAAKRSRQRKKIDAYVDRFHDAWTAWTFGSGGWTIDLPSNWRSSIARFYEIGVPIEELLSLVNVACGNNKIRPDDTFRYFAGCVWRYVTQMQDEAKELLATEAPPTVDKEGQDDPEAWAYGLGWWAGVLNERRVAARMDPLSAVVDHIEFSQMPTLDEKFVVFYWDGIHPLDQYKNERGAA